METIAIVIAVVLTVIIGLIGFAVVRALFSDKIKIETLICEKQTGSPASLSRFQFLIFTLVISLSLFYLVAETGKFPDISPEILTLLGISGGTYVVSKGIQKS